jgi:UDP-N-acetylglucosamine transferase subunit ALG13
MIRANEEEDIVDSVNSHVIDIETKYSSLNFNVSESDVDTMVQEGYRATDVWLNKYGKKVLGM